MWKGENCPYVWNNEAVSIDFQFRKVSLVHLKLICSVSAEQFDKLLHIVNYGLLHCIIMV